MSDRWALNGVETNTDDVVLDIHGNKLSVSIPWERMEQHRSVAKIRMEMS